MQEEAPSKTLTDVVSILTPNDKSAKQNKNMETEAKIIKNQKNDI